ncbi:enoyl-CoA hydratase/isomerase family protein [Phytoactinopolyspora limicola]|uniref:enoyl-CoA hydratase/isomerase family protein n=1 Tax=Phytoactinopolyspora limicola TaxID=2715536 RepID=UPI00140E49B4|nr:enoyl-CoA hydratase/isomerase family protein [Phytoactinopolyspora limicola]
MTERFSLDGPDSAVAEVVLDGQALTIADITALTTAISTLPADIGAVLVRSAGPDFCLGRATGDGPPPREPALVRETILQPILDLYASIAQAPCPVVAAVRGHARGLGFALASSCDAIIAADDAVFSLPEIQHGFAPLLALTQVTRVVPDQLAFHLAATGAPITAQELHHGGALPVVVADVDLDDRARRYTGELAARRPAVAAAKAFLARRTAGTTAEDAEYAARELALVLAAQPSPSGDPE